jgi:hypothetical protein
LLIGIHHPTKEQLTAAVAVGGADFGWKHLQAGQSSAPILPTLTLPALVRPSLLQVHHLVDNHGRNFRIHHLIRIQVLSAATKAVNGIFFAH